MKNSLIVALHWKQIGAWISVVLLINEGFRVRISPPKFTTLKFDYITSKTIYTELLNLYIALEN